MPTLEGVKKGGASRSEAKRASSARNLATARFRRAYELRTLPFPLLWLLDVFNAAPESVKYDAEFFGNVQPAGILTLPDKLDAKAVESLRRSWAEARGGEHRFKVAVLEQGAAYEKLGEQ